MKIAIVSADNLQGEDFAQLWTALAAQSQDITAYLRQTTGRHTRKTAKHNYRIVPLYGGPSRQQSYRDLLPLVGDWAVTLERRWSADQPDVVHAYGWLGGLAAQLAARPQGLPVVQTFRSLAATSRSSSFDVTDDNAERERIEPLLARNAAWVTGESNADVAVLARLRHSRARLSVMAGGVDVLRYSPVGPALAHSDLHRILCLAPNPLPCNGFDMVIRALPAVPGTELIVAETDVTDQSHDQARTELEQLAANLGVADRVHFVGTVAGEQLPRLLRSTDVLACTPRRPVRATTALQAMASGVAVVTLPVGALSDVVVHAITGLVLSPNRPAELVGALRSLSTQQFYFRSMGAAGRNRVSSRYTWDRTAFELLTIYERLTSHCVRSNSGAR
ncbi:glycosyl transferase family 1 [Mycobacterium sp. 852002-51163_SCH5372311]|uniref:glycosyltransferase n=1 Tax=Mycobacterium sp. 852002-51163_SCH5372311 TaxID=1834097 RepID=UPI0007FFA4C5|nr:glycosyltransferase [Mycobacterium sp. 852002-51163_SCH5372311]OBF81310.1 glycosyl transferase family 1 [Mycobacterium sp. 852002-51163_SCH5372311]